jgi:hypothetical protein
MGGADHILSAAGILTIVRERDKQQSDDPFLIMAPACGEGTVRISINKSCVLSHLLRHLLAQNATGAS